VTAHAAPKELGEAVRIFYEEAAHDEGVRAYKRSGFAVMVLALAKDPQESQALQVSLDEADTFPKE